jgi:hypothetical protein
MGGDDMIANECRLWDQNKKMRPDVQQDRTRRDDEVALVATKQFL